MTEQDYITKRIDNQIKWYSKKSTWNQQRYKTLKALIILISVLIPFLTGLISDETFWLKVAVGAGGVLIAFSEGILSLYKYQENWLGYRKSAETLKREKLLYQTKAGPYKGEVTFQLLVERIESYTEGENNNWINYTKTKNKNSGEKKS